MDPCLGGAMSQLVTGFVSFEENLRNDTTLIGSSVPSETILALVHLHPQVEFQ